MSLLRSLFLACLLFSSVVYSAEITDQQLLECRKELIEERITRLQLQKNEAIEFYRQILKELEQRKKDAEEKKK